MKGKGKGKGKGIKGIEFFFVAYVIIVIFTALAGFRFVSVYFGSENKTQDSQTYDKYYVIISDNNQSSFWKSVYEGAYNHGLDNNVYVEDLAATMSDNYSKEELMKIAIASNVDGIMISADDSEEMTELINEAMSRNIPVVTLYNDALNSERISYVGVSNYNIGGEYGRQALSLATTEANNNPDKDVIDVVVLVNQTPTSGQMMVYSTIQEAFDNDALADKLQLSIEKIDNSNTFTAEETIRDIFINREAPDIIICLSELDTVCVYQAVIDYNKVGMVHILGYYESDSILQGIDRNIIDSTIKVDTTQMGEYCIDALFEYDKVGFTSQYFAVDVEVINKDNIDEYMEVTDNEA
ncbi:MAG: substrate-binding domain-containing protein [Saccharofermentans sp.]|nr:substrate-binding domain-containing protein [Saccharofermentans sp.]